jgi:hypothetical protein
MNTTSARSRMLWIRFQGLWNRKIIATPINDACYSKIWKRTMIVQSRWSFIRSVWIRHSHLPLSISQTTTSNAVECNYLPVYILNYLQSNTTQRVHAITKRIAFGWGKRKCSTKPWRRDVSTRQWDSRWHTSTSCFAEKNRFLLNFSIISCWTIPHIILYDQFKVLTKKNCFADCLVFGDELSKKMCL